MRHAIRATALAVILHVAGVPTSAISAADGRIAGQVRDAQERPLAEAHVTLRSGDGRSAGEAISAADGAFAFTGLAPGTYVVLAERTGFEAASAAVTLSAVQGQAVDIVMTVKPMLVIEVTARKLDVARNDISPRIGASVYDIDRRAIETSPQGANAPFNQVLLQAPGVAQDSFGQLHVRGDHANLQYRINGILLPEGISGFGQTLDPRFAASADLITGALPAQYGYRTAGVIDVKTKNGAFDQGGEIGVYGGAYRTLQPSFEALGRADTLNYYVDGSYLQDDRGIEPPTSARSPIHDHTQQDKAFVYLSDVIDPDTRISLIQGNSIAKFQIPNNPGQPTQFALAGAGSFDSSLVNENQTERDHYGVVALQKSYADADLQVALFSRYSSILFTPDPVADLLFNGVATRVRREALANGIQGDGSYHVSGHHTVRAGVFVSGENGRADNSASVFPAAGGAQSSNVPFAIVDNSERFGWLGGIYVQDEWRITPDLTINYGARFDAMDEFIRAHQLSPRVNAVYRVTESTTLHGGVSRYFTPPPLELIAPKSISKFVNTTNAPNSLVDDPVRPERSTYYDVGVTRKLTPAIQLGLDGYYKRSRDLLDEGQFGQALVFSPFNYHTGKVYGLEATAAYREGDVSAYANLAYSHAYGRNIVSSQFQFDPAEIAFVAENFVHLDHDQRYTASAGAAYSMDGTVFSIDGIYASGLRRGFANTGHMPDYTQINLGVSHGFATQAFGNLVARFDVLNVFDEKYEIRDGTGIGVGAPQFGIRRALFAGLSKTF
ncbi:MAG TPA: TonB-dependent receptor [Candidatus Cybelea sp.]|nr:TonB-dependent receptor [Candidatus Cybelea sp.]